MARFDISEWFVLHGRVTGFAMDELQGRLEEHVSWQELMGTEAEACVIKPREQLLEEAGPISRAGLEGGARLILRKGRPRLDLLLQTTPTPQTSRLDNVGRLPEVEGILRDLGKKWFALPTAPKLKRLALALDVVHPEAGRDGGYHQLQDYLHNLRVDGESQDLLFQINRPRKSRFVEGLQMNRLCKWSVGMLAVFQVTGPGSRNVSRSYYTDLDLDMSTSADREEALPMEAVPNLLDECGILALEVAKEGDVA